MVSCLITGKIISIDMLAGQTCQCANCQQVRIKDKIRRSQNAMIYGMLIPKGKLFVSQSDKGDRSALKHIPTGVFTFKGKNKNDN